MVATRHVRRLAFLATSVIVYLKATSLLLSHRLHSEGHHHHHYNSDYQQPYLTNDSSEDLTRYDHQNNTSHYTPSTTTINNKDLNQHHHHHQDSHNPDSTTTNINKQTHNNDDHNDHHNDHKHRRDVVDLSREEQKAGTAGDEGEEAATGGNSLGMLVVEVVVRAAGVAVWVDGAKVFHVQNQTLQWGDQVARFHAGLHLVTLNERTGEVMRAETFLTWQPETSRQVGQALRDAGEGRLLVLVGLPEFTEFLAPEVVRQLASFGSVFAERLAKDEAWCMVAWKGAGVSSEVLTTIHHEDGTNTKEASPIMLHLLIPLRREPRCGWHAAKGMEQHAAFCSAFDGYGAFCSCHEPPWSPRPASPVPYGLREAIPVAVVTARRLPRVLRQLAQLWASPGGLHTPVSIFVDGHSPEARSLAALLDVPLTEHHHNAAPGSTRRINAHIKAVLGQVFQQHPAADKAIILEDDLDLAPDFIPFFQQTAALLTADSGLFCVNAFNRNAFLHTAYDSARLYRVRGVPGLGWMVRRREADEMVKQWAPDDTGLDWDLWVRQAVMGDRDVLVPEVPRTKHVGGGGVHVTGLEQALYHGRRPLNARPLVALDVKGALRDRYLHTHHAAIAEAQVVRITEHPCKVLPLPRHHVNETFVIYLHQRKETIASSWAYYVAARCLGLNDHIAYENLDMMYTFPFFGNQLYLVGCPSSPFCLTKDERDTYNPREEDVTYARLHPFRRLRQRPRLVLRGASSYEDEVNLNNLISIDLKE